MKTYAHGLLAVVLGLTVATGALAFDPALGGYTPGAGINLTPHDLSTSHNGMNYVANPDDPLDRICIFCHTPHNSYRLNTALGGPAAGEGSGPMAGAEYDYLPLWNHTLQANTAYTMYQNGPGAPQTGPKALQAFGAMTPGSVSLLCLSCHDGTVAPNSYGNSDQPASSQSLGGGATIDTGYVIGKDLYLGNHHPIGFDYEAVAAVDTEIRPSSTVLGADGSTIADHLVEGNRMECSTCHSVHNTGNGGEMLLWRSDQASELCLTCHAKGDAP